MSGGFGQPASARGVQGADSLLSKTFDVGEVTKNIESIDLFIRELKRLRKQLKELKVETQQTSSAGSESHKSKLSRSTGHSSERCFRDCNSRHDKKCSRRSPSFLMRLLAPYETGYIRGSSHHGEHQNVRHRPHKSG